MQIVESRTAQIVAFTGLLVTLVVSPYWNFDPINPSKVLISSTLSWAVLGMILSRKLLRNNLDNVFVILSTLFVLWMFIVLFFSGAPKSQQIWGMFGRNTGIVAYISLVILMLTSTTLKSIQQWKIIIRYFNFIDRKSHV